MKICILNIATNKYIQFVEQLLESVEENFLNGHDISALIFTDHEIEEVSDNVKISQIEHEPWPIPTLKRYNYFISEKEYISQFDYCFYLDVDMRIEDKVGEEILGDLVATQHPYQSLQSKAQQSFCRDARSLSFVPWDTETVSYYAGGFNGGSTKKFLEMSEVIADRVNEDLKNGVIATWHDESHMNRYLIDNPPSISLTPSYCFAEELKGNKNYPFKPKIIALQKNHSELRK